jgi:general nucleoside transport system permease protein
MIDITQEIIGSSLRIATPLALAALGELVTEKSGVLNLGVEGIMYGSAFVGIATAAHTGSLTTGLIAALVTGAAAGLIFAFLTVTLGVNQHVALHDQFFKLGESHHVYFRWWPSEG